MQAETQGVPRAGAAIQVRDLHVAYGSTPVLHGVSLDFTPGTFTALLGSSGCGKTTLLRSIAGFVPLDAGSILVGGRDITRLPPEKRGMAMVFQSYALWPHMTVAQNIGYGLQLRGCRAGPRSPPRSRRDAGAARARRARATARSRSSPAASASASRSAGRWRSTRPCCCSTSRCPTSTPRSASRLRHEIRALQQRHRHHRRPRHARPRGGDDAWPTASP